MGWSLKSLRIKWINKIKCLKSLINQIKLKR